MSPPKHLHKDYFLRTNSYIETCENRKKSNYYMFMSVRLCQPSPISSFIRQIFNAKMQLKIYHYLF